MAIINGVETALFEDEDGKYFSDEGFINAFSCVQNSVSGPMAVLMIWNEECGTYIPCHARWHFSTTEEARDFALSWAEAEEVRYL